jgi:hypothetical protein
VAPQHYNRGEKFLSPTAQCSHHSVVSARHIGCWWWCWCEQRFCTAHCESIAVKPLSFVLVDNDNKQLWYWLILCMYLLCYTFYHYFIVYSFYLLKIERITVKFAGLHGQLPYTSHVDCISWLHQEAMLHDWSVSPRMV